MKKRILSVMLVAACTCTFPGSVLAADSETAQLREEIAKLSAKLAQLEAKQNATDVKVSKPAPKPNVSFFFDNRIQYNRTSLGPGDGGHWAGGTGKIDQRDQFMERIRMYMSASVGDQWRWDARLVQAKFNINKSDDSQVRFDRFWVTNNNVWGGKLEIGKMWLYPGKGAFYGNTGDTEGIYYSKKIDRTSFRVGTGRNGGTDVSFGEVSYKPTPKSDIGIYMLKQNYKLGPLKLKDMNLLAVNGAMELPGKSGLALSFEYAKNRADTIPGLMQGNESGYFIALQSKYAATNYMPALFTQLVNPFQKGDHGWALSYRKMPAGAAGFMNRGAFSWVPLTTDDDGTWQNTFNDVKAWRFDYIYVPWKNVQWTFTYDRVQPLNGNWTNHSIQSTLNYFF